MVFLWPSLLWLLLIVPLLVLLYVWLLRRRKAQAVHYPGLDLVRQALGSRAQWRRHVPPLLFLLGLAALLLAAARPLAMLQLPAEQQTIILAMDVSGSMRATDVEPDRLTAAQNAAKAFIKDLPRHVRVGVVAFAGTAQLAALPLIVAGAPVWVILLAAFCVNLRFVVFSVHLRNYVMHLPFRERMLYGYLSGDVNYVLFIQRYPQAATQDPQLRGCLRIIVVSVWTTTLVTTFLRSVLVVQCTLFIHINLLFGLVNSLSLTFVLPT